MKSFYVLAYIVKQTREIHKEMKSIAQDAELNREERERIIHLTGKLEGYQDIVDYVKNGQE